MNDKMLRIVKADVYPKVFKVYLVATDHSCGFEAIAEFRSNKAGVSSVFVHDESPEVAMDKLYELLTSKFGRCVHCNSFKVHDEQ